MRSTVFLFFLVLGVTVVLKQSVHALRELFPRYAVLNGDYSEEALLTLTEYGASLNSQKLNSSCDEKGCLTSFSKSLNIVTSRGSAARFDLQNDNFQNTTIQVTVSSVNYSVVPEYLYTSYSSYAFAGWVSENYNPEDFERCQKEPTWPIQVNARTEKLGSFSGGRYVVSGSKFYRRDLSVWETSMRFMCNHHYLTRFMLCTRRTLVTDLFQGIVVFAQPPFVTLKITLALTVGDETKQIVVEPLADQPFELEVDGITLSVAATGDIINPLSGRFLMARFQRWCVTCPLQVVEWLSATSVPDMSTVTTGLSKYKSQILFPQEPYKSNTNPDAPYFHLLFDPSLLDEGDLVSCGRGIADNTYSSQRFSRFSFSKPTSDNSYHYSYNSPMFAAFSQSVATSSRKVAPDLIFDNKFLDFGNDSVESLGNLDKDCCLRIKTSSLDFLYSLSQNYYSYNTIHSSMEFDMPSIIPYSPRIVPAPLSIVSRNLYGYKLNAVISSTNLHVPYSSATGDVTSATVPEMGIVTSASGSYFTYVIEYVGGTNIVAVDCATLELLRKSIAVTSTGTYKGSIAFKSPNIVQSHSICFGTTRVCVKPQDVKAIDSPTGGVDEPDESTCSDQIPSFFGIIFSNASLGVLAVFMIIIDIFFGIILLKIAYRTFPMILTTVLLLRSSNVNKVNAICSTCPTIDIVGYNRSFDVFSARFFDRNEEIIIPPPSIISHQTHDIDAFFNSSEAYLLCPDRVVFTTGEYIYPKPGSTEYRADVKSVWLWSNDYSGCTNGTSCMTLPISLPGFHDGQEIFTSYYYGSTNISVFNTLPSISDTAYIYSFDHPTSYRDKLFYSVLLYTPYDTHICPDGRFSKLFFLVPNSRALYPILQPVSDFIKYVKNTQIRFFDLISLSPITFDDIDRFVSSYYSGPIDVNAFICSSSNDTLFKATIALSCLSCSARDPAYRLLRSAIKDVTYDNPVYISEHSTIYTENALYTKRGMYKPSSDGPLTVIPHTCGNCTVSLTEDGDILFLKVSSLLTYPVSYSLNDNLLTYQMSSSSLAYKPVERSCTGSLWLDDQTSLLACDSDCCLTSFDDYDTFELLDAGSSLAVPERGLVPVEQYRYESLHMNFVCSNGGCQYSSINSAYECAYKHHPSSTVFLFYFPLIILGAVFVIFLIKYILTGMLKGFNSLWFLSPSYYADKFMNVKSTIKSSIKPKTKFRRHDR